MAIDKNAVIKEAQKLAAKGLFDKAIAEWKKVAKESPDDANVFNTIGDLCLKKNSKPEAVEAYQKAADILAADGFTSKALALYKKVLNIDPKKIEAHLALGNLNAEKGLTGAALESYKVVADHYALHDETAKALGIYQKMADLNASNVVFRLKLADMYAKEGMKKEAVSAYLQAADVHVSKEAFTDARQIFEKALAIDANNKDVYHKAGLVFYKEGKFVEACKALKPAFESDAKNAELADLYLDSLAKAGRGADAAEVYRKMLEQDPGRTDLREKLYQLYLSQKEFDKAFVEVSSLTNQKIEAKDFDGAEGILKAFIAEAPRSIEGRQALSAVYKTTGKTSEAAAVLVAVAQTLIEDGDKDRAKEMLSRALELEPEQRAARHMLDQLQPATPKPEPAAVQPPPEQPKPAAPKPTPAPAATPAPAPLFAPDPVAEDPALVESISEIDVLIKYGLTSKAAEQLEALAKKYPESIPVRIKLSDVYGDMGSMAKAVVHMVALADLYSARGQQGESDKVLQAARQMDPNNAQIKARFGAAVPAAAVAPAPPADEMLASLELAPLDIPAESALPELQPEAAPLEEISFDQPLSVPDFEPPDLEVAEEPVGMEQVVPEEPEVMEQLDPELPAGVEELDPEVHAFTEQPVAEPVSDEREVALPEAESSAEEEVDLGELWAEAEFYYQQGLFDEARRHYEKIIEYSPDNARVQARLKELKRDVEEAQAFSQLADAVDELEGFEGLSTSGAPAKELPTSASDEEAVQSLMQEIAQLKQKTEKSPPMPELVEEPSTGRSARKPAPAPAAEEDFFDLGAELSQMSAKFSGSAPVAKAKESPREESDDFFDLASELRDELSSVSVPLPASTPAQEQSLDDIFEEFKKGVEQQSVKEDTDTHYNLGIAYKEMGLLDDAIGEFLMTPDDEPKFAQSRHMLGLCYMEKGEFENAIAEIEQAITSGESQGRSDSGRISMHYDLGLAYQGAGDSDAALKEFQTVRATNAGYRDVSDKIKELEQGDVISMEQLKDDIEREISSKFLEEGERIEREEKTKKNEKVRN